LFQRQIEKLSRTAEAQERTVSQYW